jgi:hypothetical protein
VKRTEESVGDASPQQPPRPAGPEYALFFFSLFALAVFASSQRTRFPWTSTVWSRPLWCLSRPYLMNSLSCSGSRWGGVWRS